MLPDERTFCFPGTQPLRMTHGLPGRKRAASLPQPAGGEGRRRTGRRRSAPLSPSTRTCRSTATSPGSRRKVPNSARTRTARCSVPTGRRHWHIVNPWQRGLLLNRQTEAQFAVIESVDPALEPGGWAVTHHRAAYDRAAALDAYARRGMLEAGGVMSHLSTGNWVTAEVEIIYFYRWLPRERSGPRPRRPANCVCAIRPAHRSRLVCARKATCPTTALHVSRHRPRPCAFLCRHSRQPPALEAVVADSARPGRRPGLSGRRPGQPRTVEQRGDGSSSPTRVAGDRGQPRSVVGRIFTLNNTPPFTNRDRFRSLWWTASTLAPRHLAVLRRLPAARIALPGLPPIRLSRHSAESLRHLPGDGDATVRRHLAGVAEPSSSARTRTARLPARWRRGPSSMAAASVCPTTATRSPSI